MSKEKVGKKKKKKQKEKRGCVLMFAASEIIIKVFFFLLVNAEMAMYDRIPSLFIYGNSYRTYLFIY